MQLKNILSTVLVFAVLTSVSAQKYTQKQNTEVTKEWKSHTFSSQKTLAENIAEVESFSLLNKALDKQMVSTMDNEEMVTVFAPVDAGFMKLSKASRDSLMARTPNFIEYYVVAGRVDANTLESEIERNNGTVYLLTLSGEKLGARKENDKIVLFDAKNNKAVITASDYYHKNGFFHIIEGVLFPSPVN